MQNEYQGEPEPRHMIHGSSSHCMLSSTENIGGGSGNHRQHGSFKYPIVEVGTAVAGGERTVSSRACVRRGMADGGGGSACESGRRTSDVVIKGDWRSSE